MGVSGIVCAVNCVTVDCMKIGQNAHHATVTFSVVTWLR